MPDDSTRPRVLHVAESFGGGVGAAILDYVRATPEYDHDLVYAERADAPVVQDVLTPLGATYPLPPGHLRRVRYTREILRRREYAVLHAHSSFGGAYARLAVRRKHQHIVYTPHCYAYERRDIGGARRLTYHLIEAILGVNTSALLACSPREARISVTPRSTPRIFVPNVAPIEGLPRRSPRRGEGSLRVVGAGRAAPQKDPDYFFACVRAAREAGVDVEAVWVGGDDDLVAQGRRAQVRVTGWIPRSEALQTMADADVYLHSAAWEGFPVAILEAVAMRIPTVVRAIPAFDGTGLPSIDLPEDFGVLARSLVDEAALAEILAAATESLRDYTPATQRTRLMAGYGGRASEQARDSREHK